MSIITRREIPMWIVTITGVFMLIAYFFPEMVGTAATQIKAGSALLAGFVLIYGGIVGMRRNAMNVIRRVDTEGTLWYWDAYALAVILLYIISALIDPMRNSGAIPKFLYGNVATAGFGALFSSLAYWNMSAVLSIIKVRTWPVATLVVVMLVGFLALSPMMAAFIPQLQTLYTWFANVPGAAGARGLIMAIGIGAIALSVRLILQKESGWMGEM